MVQSHPTREGLVNHRIKEFVRGEAHTNGIEAFWAMLKRGHYGVFHHFSAKRLHCYVGEFTDRHSTRALDTIEQMAVAVLTGIGERLRYVDLIGPKHATQPGCWQLLSDAELLANSPRCNACRV